MTIGAGPKAEPFEELLDDIRTSVAERLNAIASAADLGALPDELVRPAAKWTYLEHEIPMRSDRYRQIDVFQSMLRDAFR